MKNLRVTDEYHKKLMKIQGTFQSTTGEKLFLYDILDKLTPTIEKSLKLLTGGKNGNKKRL